MKSVDEKNNLFHHFSFLTKTDGTERTNGRMKGANNRLFHPSALRSFAPPSALSSYRHHPYKNKPLPSHPSVCIRKSFVPPLVRLHVAATSSRIARILRTASEPF